MNTESDSTRLQSIQEGIRRVQEERIRKGHDLVRATQETQQVPSGMKARLARLPLVGALARWAYGLVKAPARIRDLLTMVRLGEMEASRDRAEARAVGVEVDEALAALRAAHAASADGVGESLARAGRLESKAASLEAEQALVLKTAEELRLRAGRAEEKVDGVESALGAATRRLSAAEEQAAAVKGKILAMDSTLSSLQTERQLREAELREAAGRQAQVAGMYEHLEEQFRGRRDLVRERLSIYLPAIQELKTEPESLPVVDLGCGRGEWLQTLQAAAIPGLGVDSNPALVTACRAAGLQVEEATVDSFLAARPDESVAAVTIFHLLEHLAFPDWLHLIQEAWRVLAPGGVAIFETPNPDNVLVAGSDFHLDPTHVRPIPSRLLLLIAQRVGFQGCRVMELHPREIGMPVPAPGEFDLLRDHFHGPQDYSILGWKGQPPSS